MESKITADGPYLDADEQQAMELHDRGAWQPLQGQALVETKAKLRTAARNTLTEIENKTERMNIRMTLQDMSALKAAAEREGMPYQSLVTSILHKFTTGRLVDLEEARKVLGLSQPLGVAGSQRSAVSAKSFLAPAKSRA